MSGVHDAYPWQDQGPVAHDIRYLPGSEDAINSQLHYQWALDDSIDRLHNPPFLPDRPRPGMSGPAYYAPDVLPASAKPLEIPTVKLVSYTSNGVPGDILSVHIRLPHDTSIVSALRFHITLLDRLLDTSIGYVGQVDNDHRYVLSTDVPVRDGQLKYGPCSLKVATVDLSGTLVGLLDIGTFTLKRAKSTNQPKASKKKSRKRQASDPIEESALPLTKKVATADQFHGQHIGPAHFQLPMDDATQIWPIPQHYQQFQYTSNHQGYHMPNESLSQNWAPAFAYQSPFGYTSSQDDRSHQHLPTSPAPSLNHSISPGTLLEPPDFGLQSPLSASKVTPLPDFSPYSEHPPLIRTTQLPNHKPVSTQTTTPKTGKVVQGDVSLRLIGSTNSMLDNWSREEKMTQRRLVEFERSQEGSTITVTFKQVPLNSRSSTNIIVSCIWWEGKKQAYITSVDTIRLLEYLVASRFNVQEKNRIRRNIEGYHPLTVAKGHPDSNDFFKVVMGYGEPRPRVIEKDIKVFPWKSLHLMLKKVIGKYSADFASTSSTAGISTSLLPPALTARSSVSGASHADPGLEPQPMTPKVQTPTHSVQINDPRTSHDWAVFASPVTHPGQHLLPNDMSFLSSDYTYYDPTTATPGLASSSTYVPGLWDTSPIAALTATPGSAFSTSDLFGNHMHAIYQHPDSLDTKMPWRPEL